MRGKQKLAVCPKCMKVAPLTRHHLTPKRFFHKKNNKNIIYLCEKCHAEIEIIIPRWRKLTEESYFELHKQWIRGVSIMALN